VPTVEVMVNLQEQVVEEARKFDLLDSERLTQLLLAEFERQEKLEAEWEEKVLTEALGDAVSEDGEIDFYKLRNRRVIVSEDEINAC
jgi:hypothetical protein